MVEKLVGKRVGNYIVTELIGEGGMGAVYRADHPDIGRKVAIKVLDPQLGDHPEVAKRFLTEARAIARIEHPNIIDIFDFGRTLDGQLYYVMELLSGVDLRRVLDERGAMTALEVRPYLDQICDGLQAAHEHDVIHRDLKPENIYLLDAGRLLLKIIDFGIARLDDPDFKGPSRTAKGVVMGTPLTIAPEQGAGQPGKIGRQTDLYSLGVILYWMLAGRPPFVNEPPAVILARHITDPPPPLRDLAPNVPAAVAELVHRCLAKAPEERPGSAAEIAEAYSQALGPGAAGAVASVSGLFRAHGPPEIATAKTMPPHREPVAADAGPPAPLPAPGRPARLPSPAGLPPPPRASVSVPPSPAADPGFGGPLPRADADEDEGFGGPLPRADADEDEGFGGPLPRADADEDPGFGGPIQRVPSAEELLGAFTGGAELEPDDDDVDDDDVVDDDELDDDERERAFVDEGDELLPDEPPVAVLPPSAPPLPLSDDLLPFDEDESQVSISSMATIEGGVPTNLDTLPGPAWSRRTMIVGGAVALAVVIGVVITIAMLSSGSKDSTETAKPNKGDRPSLELTALPPMMGSGDPEAEVRAGEKSYAAGELAAALRHFKAALRSAPRHGHALFRRGEARQARGDLALARADYSTALEADAALAAAAHFKLGEIYELQGQASQAIAEFRASMEADPAFAPPHVSLGFTYARLRRYEEALEQLDKAVELAPSNSLAFYYRGTVLFNTQREDDAITSYKKALELRPRYPEAHYYLGQVYLKKGQTAAAKAEFQAALKDDPEYEPAVLALSKLK